MKLKPFADMKHFAQLNFRVKSCILKKKNNWYKAQRKLYNRNVCNNMRTIRNHLLNMLKIILQIFYQ